MVLCKRLKHLYCKTSLCLKALILYRSKSEGLRETENFCMHAACFSKF